ncbi:MAG: CHAD domain-containing protein [Chloroflexi bacterium]|nr:CHAD domain-containing protein [Chloroflexota bacterium]
MNDHAATTGDLALAVLREQTGLLQAHAEGARSGEQPRGVHQMRVATRRLRAALRVFEDVLSAEAAGLSDELRWLAALLGAVRDLDVQLQHTGERAVELGLVEGLHPYCAWLSVERERARQTLVCGLDDERYRTLAQHLDRVGEEWRPVADTAAGVGAVRRIRPLAKKLWRAADDLGPSSAVEDLHRARIKAKRLRYAVEFYVPLLGAPAEDVVKRTVDVQDLLGEHQDTVVAGSRVRDALAGAHGGWPGETAFALGVFVQRDAERAAQIREQFPDVYRRLRGKAWKRLKTRLNDG